MHGARVPVSITDGETKLDFLLSSAKGKIKAIVQENSISFEIDITAQGDLNEVKGMIFTPEQIPDLNVRLSNRIKGIVYETLDKIQRLDSDCIGLRRALHINNLHAWEKLNSTPRTKLLSSDIIVNVNAEVTGSGKIVEGTKLNQ